MTLLRWSILLLLALPASARAQRLAFPLLPADAPAGSGRVVSCEAPGLAGRARCGVFRVWEDRARAAGRTIDLAFIVLEANSRERRAHDPIVLLPGGPGESFTGRAAGIARSLADLRHTRDILLVDVRGVGRSGALSCDVAYPAGIGARFGSVFVPAHAAACRDTLGRRTDLTMYTTAASVDDLEQLRRWLRYPQVNLVGASYGTRVAQVYMRRHPRAVRTVVMNGVAPIAEPLYVQHARMAQRALEGVVRDCAEEPACRKPPQYLQTRLEQLFARLRAAPADLELAGERVAFGPGDLAYALRGLLYDRGAEVPALIERAAAGDLTPLAAYYAQRTAWISAPGGSAGYHFSVLCAEDIAPLTDQDVVRATAGTFMGAHLIDSYRAVCRLWPHAQLPASHWTPVRSDIPTLLLSGEHDPVTPPEGAEAVAKHLTNALHVVVPGGGHGVGGPCIGVLILAFIEAASVKRLDASCVQRR